MRLHLYGLTRDACRQAILDGTASRFDTAQWDQLQPPNSYSLNANLAALAWTQNRLFIKLPRLIVLTRKLDQSPSEDSIQTTLRLAQWLLQLKCPAEERDFVESTKLVATINNELASIVPFSIPAMVLAEVRQAVYYWHTRIMVINICLRLQTLFPDHATFDNHALHDEAEMMALRILQSYECISPNIADSIWLALWSVLRAKDNFCGRPASQARDFVLRKFQRSNAPSHLLTQFELDAACEALAGGPLEPLVQTGILSLYVVPNFDS